MIAVIIPTIRDTVVNVVKYLITLPSVVYSKNPLLANIIIVVITLTIFAIIITLAWNWRREYLRRGLYD